MGAGAVGYKTRDDSRSEGVRGELFFEAFDAEDFFEVVDTDGWRVSGKSVCVACFGELYSFGAANTANLSLEVAYA